MKNKQYIYMLLAAGLTLGACSSDKDALEDELQPVQPTSADGESVGFAATTVEGLEYLADEDLDAQGGPDSRVRTISVGSDFKVTAWYTNDKISVSDGVLNYTYSPESESSDPSCNFNTSGNAFVTDGSAESENTFYAFYPQEAVSSWKGATVTSMIWAEQLYSENVEGSGILGPYIAAKSETTGGGANATFKFGHLCSVVDVDLSKFDGGTIQSVSLLSNSGASLAGRFRYNFDSKRVELVNNDGGGYAAASCISSLVTVNDVNATTATVRFYILPVKQDQGFTITVRTTEGNFYTKKSTTSVGNSTVNADYLASMANQTGSVCLPYYKKYNFNKIDKATKNMWMATIPNNLRLRQLTVPGAHNAATSNVGSNISKCQSETIAELLSNGVRAFDLRPRYTRTILENANVIELDKLEIYHGLTPTGVLFKDAVQTLVDFVVANPTEAVFIMMQKENTKASKDESETWRNSIRTCFQNHAANLLAKLDTYQNFGNARGKVVVISKNPYGSEGVYSDVVFGGIIQEWGDNISTDDAYIYQQGGTEIAKASVEDSYNITSTSTKQSRVSEMLNKAAADTSTRFYFTWNNMAYSSSGNPSDWAKTMNPWLTNFINNTVSANRLGFVYADFIGSSSYGGAALLKAIIQHNHKYVYLGRTRKSIASSGGTGTGANVSGDEYADDSEVFGKQR